ncbi:MAG: hypothetical protein DIZ77_11250 [endosymbiont of Seepiophila jonesi]|uniref:Type IV secretion system protein VirD4 n=1 Tax=endosymbiont of Lamellibrachia luymesi TaxID=2200907 RepID=A0A370E094_9GAMM|nr:MAG: hypothetical protein DIZ79_06410 [endosymbiont of Lamellibrachia luymesi]RDH91379.1 MAG: hypothetical protein DIZ77_11250 [endosymbiont of Seepiophila jonesi]
MLFYILSFLVLVGFFYGGVWFEYNELLHPKLILADIKSQGDLPDNLFYGLLSGFAGAIFISLFNPFKQKLTTYGDASFATKSYVKKIKKFDERGIILGAAFGTYIRSNEPLSTLLLAPPGTGKTAGFVIPNLFSCGNSMVIFDVKGELYKITSKRRAEFSRVLKFEPASPDSAMWNPLAKESLPRDWVEQMVVIDRIATMIYPQGEKHDHWITEGKNMFLFYAMFLVWRNGGSSIPEIRAFSLDTSDAQIAIEEMLTDNENMPDRIRQEGNGLIQKPENEFGSVFSTYKSKLNVFADPYVAKALSGNEFTFSEFRKNRTSLYLVIKAQDVERLAPVVTLLFEMCAMYILSNAPKPEDHTVTLMIDEFARLGKMQQVLDMPALSRGNRGHAMLIAQDYAQINRLYGNDGGEILDGTCSHFIIYPQNNAKTAKNFSEKIGFQTTVKKSKSQSTRDTNISTSLSEEKIPLISQQDFLSMPEWSSYIIVQNHFKRPIKASPVKWFEDPLMKNLAGCVDDDFQADPDIEEKIKDSISGVPSPVINETEVEEIHTKSLVVENKVDDEPELSVEHDPYDESEAVVDINEQSEIEIVNEVVTDDNIDSVLEGILENIESESESDEEKEEVENEDIKKNSAVDLFG